MQSLKAKNSKLEHQFTETASQNRDLHERIQKLEFEINEFKKFQLETQK